MHLTLNSLTALRIIRSIRAGRIAGNLTRRCGFSQPDHSPSKSWTKSRIASGLAFLGDAAAFSEKRPLDVLVDDKRARLRTKGVSCTLRTGGYPHGAFVDLGHGIAMSSPELVFIELARVMDPSVHLLLGMELCGRFSRDAENPRGGRITYGIEPVTSVGKLRTFAKEAHWIRGAEQALATVDRIVENAWSPMEALVAALIVLPADKLGYDLWPIRLNPRKELGERLIRLSDAASRVPDIMFSGTNVGINYDGEDHFGLGAIADAAVHVARDPGNAGLIRELDEAIAEARARIVADKRRDRDLMAMGLTVFPSTKEDIEERRGLDRLMGQVIEAIEAEGARNLSDQRRMLKNRSRAAARQEFIWSLMPRSASMHARKRLEGRMEALERTREFEIEFKLEDGSARVVSLVEL